MTKEELAQEVIRRLKERRISGRRMYPGLRSGVEASGKRETGCTVYRCEGKCDCGETVCRVSKCGNSGGGGAGRD